ncbi:MAG: hypothetical protein K1X66_07675 [Verrucomicrobiae bacterium]|nr:hypothetical protein [Verrucomicrobiae bacterium]
MKEPITTFALSLLCFLLLMTNVYQWQTAKALRQETHQLNERLVAQTKRAEKAFEKRQEQREKRRLQIAQTIKARDDQEINEETTVIPSPMETKPTQEKAKNNNNPLAQLMANPQMKEIMRAQQHMMVEKNYRDFIQHTTLSPEAKEKLMALIEKEQMQQFESVQQIFGGTNSRIRTKNDSVKNEIKELLGEDQYTQFKNYQKTLSERMVVGGFVDQMASSDMPIQPYQKEQLTQILIDEYQHNRLNRMSDNQALNAMTKSQKTSDDYFTKQRELNERILARAQTILNPEQLKRYKAYQESILNLQEASMKMFQPQENKP